MRLVYHHRHPRGDKAECIMVTATTEQQCEYLKSLGYTRLGVAEARRHLAAVNARRQEHVGETARQPIRLSDALPYREMVEHHS